MVGTEIINLIAAILAIVIVIYLYVMSGKFTRALRKGFMLISTGVLVAIGVHAIVEFMEAYNILLDMSVLHWLMPVLVMVGSSIILYGVHMVYKTLQSVE